MQEYCGKCNVEWNGREEFCPCSGICNKNFHLKCAGINTATYNQLMKSRQLRWYCTACSETTILAVLQKLDELSGIMIKLFESFSVMNEFMKSSIEAQCLTAQSLQMKFPVDVSSNHLGDNIGDIGKNVPPEVLGVGEPVPSLQPVEIHEMDNLYVSRLNPNTEVQAVIDYVRSKLVDVDRADCRILLPKGRDKIKLSFVSFKLTIDKKFSSQILSPTFWPRGVLVRRFIRKANSKNSNGVSLPLSE